MIRELFNISKKKDSIGPGSRTDTRPGWGKRLAEGIVNDIALFGIDPSLLPSIEITDEGFVTVDFINGRGEKERRTFSTYDNNLGVEQKTIIRDDYEITDNQLREWLNRILYEIYDNQKRTGKQIDPPSNCIHSIFYTHMAIGNEKWITCAILDKMNANAANCTNTQYGPMDCRRCIIPQLFQDEAKYVVRERLTKKNQPPVINMGQQNQG